MKANTLTTRGVVPGVAKNVIKMTVHDYRPQIVSVPVLVA